MPQTKHESETINKIIQNSNGEKYSIVWLKLRQIAV